MSVRPTSFFNHQDGASLSHPSTHLAHGRHERVEDSFLIDGPELQQNKRQIEIETELLEALAA